MSKQKEDAGETPRDAIFSFAALRAMEDGDISGYNVLWRGVIMRVFQDASFNLDDVKTDIKYRDVSNIRASALVWLRGNSEDFHRVCHLAKCDPENVRIAAKDMFGSLIHELQIPIDVYDARSALAARGVES